MAILHEELGRALCVSPLFPSLIGGQALLQWASEELRREWLPKVASGERVVTYAIEEPGPGKLRAQVIGSVCTVRGAYHAVPLGHAADAYIVTAKAGRDFAVCLVERAQPGVRSTRMHTIGGAPLAAVQFKDAQGAVLATGEAAQAEMDALLLRCRLMLAAEMTGGARAALEIALEYAKQRVAFGRPIGTFQALQHKMANMSMRIEGAQAALYYAATLLSQKKPARAACAAAQLQALDACRFAATEGIQVFGGIGAAGRLQVPGRRPLACDRSDE